MLDTTYGLRVAKPISMIYTAATMDKATAITLIGPSLSDAARAIGVTNQAISQWPDPLPRRIEDRVLAAQARRYLPPHLLGQAEKPPTRQKPRSKSPQ
jgi:hypothetical protein